MSEEQVAEQEEQQDDSPVETDAEVQAREMGWKPQDEWDGDPSGWVDADRFIERQQKLAQRGDAAAKREIERLNKRLAEVEEVNRKTLALTENMSKRAYEQAKRDLEKKQREAVADGDTAAYDAASQEMQELDKTYEAQEPKKQENPDNDPEFIAFKDENPWYGDTDDVQHIEMTAFAEQIAPVIGRKYPQGGKPFYDAVAKAVAEKFGNGQARSRARAVEGSGGAKGNRGKGFDSLPSEAKQAFEKFYEQGLYTDAQGEPLPKDKAQQAYIRDYEEA